MNYNEFNVLLEKLKDKYKIKRFLNINLDSLLDYADENERKYLEIRKKYGSSLNAEKHTGISRKKFDRIIKKVLYKKLTIDGEKKFIEDFPNIINKPIEFTENNSEEILLKKYYIKGTSTLYDKDGNIKLQWVKTDVSKEQLFENLKEALKDILEDLKAKRYEDNKKLSIKPNIKFNEDLLTVYPIGDHHLGMFSWHEETNEDYDIDLAFELLIDAFSQLIQSTPNTKIALLANLGDFFHIDDTRNETLRSGNRLDVDTRYPKILKTGLQLIVKIIEMLLEKHEKVIVRNAIGNHDPHTTFFLNEYIKAWFNNNERIIIYDDIKTFWFYKFGKNLIGITHGDTCKLNDLPEIMAADAAEYWSDTEFRYWYIGHFHHQQKKEFRTCIIESFGTLAAKDAWHYSSGYRSQRQIKYKLLHKDFGEIQEGTINIKYLKYLKGIKND